jgi:hypothetical protein
MASTDLDYIKGLAEEVAEATERNDHTGAVLMIAEYFNYKKYVALLESIQVIQEIENSIPEEIAKYRNSILNMILTLIKKNYGKGVYDILYSAF